MCSLCGSRLMTGEKSRLVAMSVAEMESSRGQSYSS